MTDSPRVYAELYPKSACPGPPACGHACVHGHCASCGDPIIKDDDDRAIEEYAKTFGRLPDSDTPMACDTCYQAMMKQILS